ncbi:TPA: McrB family protein [Streptococcus suis]
MDFYIPSTEVINSIKYFKELSLDSDDSLFLFLINRMAGISTTYPVTVKVGDLSDEKRKDYLQSIWLFAGLFDTTEAAEHNSLMFPNNFSKVGLYQPGSPFSGVVGRVRDTIKQKNVIVPLYETDSSISVLKLKRNYQEVLAENYLKGNKISLKHLAAWLFRFSKFEFDSTPDEKQFTRVIDKHIRKLLKITKKDFLWLFEDDLSFNRISPAEDSITGITLREQFEFNPKRIPEISKGSNTIENEYYTIGKSLTEQYLSLNGDNPTDADIELILRDKKQIVLTGVPGVGKSRYTGVLSDAVFSAERTETVQFHANYSYEDFIGSETLVPVDGATGVTTKKGVFLEFIERATLDPDNDYLFIIDELNRGNIAEIFGETILTLDRGYSVRLTKEIAGVKKIEIPKNIFIVGTMNTSDRNIAFLDLAIRRRFGFVNLLPNYDYLSEKVKFEEFDLGNVLKAINQRIVEVLGDQELLLGQSYFIPNNDEKTWTVESFKNQFNFVLLPTLKEYSFNDFGAVNAIVGENLADSIQDTEEFLAAFSAEFSF